VEALEDRTVPSTASVTVLGSQIGQFIYVPGYGVDIGADVTVNLSPGTYAVDTQDQTGVYGTFTIANDLTISGTTGALVSTPTGIGFDLTKLALVNVPVQHLGDEFLVMSGAGGAIAGNGSRYLPPGTYSIYTAGQQGFFGTFTVGQDLAVDSTTGALIPTPTGIDFDLTQLDSVSIGGNNPNVFLGIPGATSGNEFGRTDYLPSGTYDITTAGGGYDYGTFTISSTLTISATTGSVIATPTGVSFDFTKLATVSFLQTAPGGFYGIFGVSGGGTFRTTHLPAGTYNVQTADGNGSYGTFTVSQCFTISGTTGALVSTPAGIDVDLCELNTVTFTPAQGASWGIRAYIPMQTGAATLYMPDGTYPVTISANNSTTTASFTVGASGLSTTQLPQANPLVTLQLVPCQDETTTTVTASVNPSLLNQPVSFTANVSVQDGDVATGSVQFLIDGANFGSPVALTSGSASITTATLGLGPHTITAVYSSGGEFDGSKGSATATVIPPASLSGVVWEDFNDDGQVDFGENGIRCVTITLSGTDNLGNTVNQSQVTDGDGAHVFLNLRPGNYYLTETPPVGYVQGIDSVGTAGGSVSATDQFFVALGAGVNGLNYNFGELPPSGASVQPGQTATIGFWNNKNGQALIKALNGGTGHQLGDWLAATLPNMFGASSANDLAGQSNAAIAALFQQDFVMKGVKLDAQVLATALSVYATNATLDPTQVAAKYGFTVSGNGAGTATWNVGSNGAAFGVADNSTLTLMDLLLDTDAQAVNGLLYNGNTARRNQANAVYSALNQAGDIS
jgi:hypothetical protein